METTFKSLIIDKIKSDKFTIYIWFNEGIMKIQKSYLDSSIGILTDLKNGISYYDECFNYSGLPLVLIRKINKWFKDNGIDKTCKNILTKGY